MSTEALDKLYSRFISTNRQISHHPIIDLMLIRNDKTFLAKIPEDSQEFIYFSELPMLDMNHLQELHKNLLEKSFSDAFEGEFKSIFAFKDDFFNQILTLREQSQNKENGCLMYILVSHFFCWLEFILDSSNNSQKLTLNNLNLFINEIEKYGSLPIPFSTIESYLFSRFIESFLNCDSYKFDNESLQIISHHIKIDETLDNEFSSIFLRLVQKSTDKLYKHTAINDEQLQQVHHFDSEGADSLLETLNIAIEYRRKSISHNDFQKLAVILVPLIDNLNINAINVISNLSTTITELPFTEFNAEKDAKIQTPSLKDSFILLPPLLLKKLQQQKEGPFITPNDFPHYKERVLKIDLENEKQTNEIIWHFTDNQYALENGFNQISIERPSILNSLLPVSFSKFLLSFANALKKADGSCIDNFFMALFKLLDALDENADQLFYELYVSALSLAYSCVGKITLYNLLEMFNKKTIFYPELTIFDNSISDGKYDVKVRSIRYHVLNLFASQMDQLIPIFLKDACQYPFLFAEELAFVSCASHMNLQVFMLKDFVVSIFTVIKSLMNGYFKYINTDQNDEKERYFIALQTVLSFLFKLLENRSIEMQYFSLDYFISNFYGFVFVDFLKPFILMTMSDFLLNLEPNYSENYQIIETVTSYFTHLYAKLNEMKIENENQINLIIGITNNLLSALSMNMKLSPFFSNVLDSFLELKLNFPEQLPLGLRFLSLVSSNSSNSINKRMNNNINCDDETKLTSKQLRLVIYLIKKIEGNNPSQATKISLMNLCAASVALGIDSLFLILRPSMIPLLFIAYGESKQLMEVLYMFNELCDFSETNCVAVHESGIDKILLEFVYNFMINKTNIVNFRGIEFKLNFNENDIFNDIFPFLEKIFTVSANNVDVGLLNNLICSFKQPVVCNTVASFVLRLLLKQKTKVSPTFPLGFKQAPLEIKNVSPNVINVSFSFITWIKVDRPISLQMSQSVPIITITDKTRNKKSNMESTANVFSLFINRGCLYYQFNDQLELINQQIPSNTWVFIGFVCQRTTQQLSCIGLFTEFSMLYCDDVPAVFFPKESKLTITIGGSFHENKQTNSIENNENKLAVLMGPFAILNKMLDDSVFDVIEKQGPFAIDDFWLDGENKNLIFRSINGSHNIDICDEYKKTVKVETNVVPYYNNLHQKSFYRVFCMNDQNLLKLMEVFIRYDEAPSNLVNLIFAIMKQVFDAYYESQQNFSSNFGILKQYLMKNAKENATFHLYKSFVSISDVIRNQESICHLFDNLLVNVELYSKGPPSSFERIIKNWSLYLLYVHRSLFTRKNFFNRLIKMYVHLFSKKRFDDRYDERTVNRIRRSFCTLLERASKYGLTKDSIFYFENFINIQTENEKNLYTFLSILERNISKLRENADYNLTLHHFAESENNEISQLAIILIHELAKPNWMKPMMALALQLKAKITNNKNDATMKNSLIKFLLDNASKYPGFIHLIAALTTAFENDEKKKVADRLKDIFCYNLNTGSTTPDAFNSSLEDIVKDRYWFIWLLTAAIHSEGSAQLSFLTIISTFLVYADDLYTEMNKIVNVLQIYEAVDKTFDYCQIVLDLFINLNAVNMSFSKFLLIPLFRALFFRFNDFTYSRGIVYQFLTGPYKKEYIEFKKFSNTTFNNDDLLNNDHPKYDILSLEPLLVQDFSKYKLNLSYDENAGNSKNDGKLGHFLLQLVETCKDIQFNKFSPNQVISNFLGNSANNGNSSVNANNNDNESANNSFIDDTPTVQTSNDISNLIAYLSCGGLLDFVHFMIDVDENRPENGKTENSRTEKIRAENNRAEQMSNFVNNFPKIQKKFNSVFLKSIFISIDEIKNIIKNIKALVFVDFDSVKKASIENLKNSDYVSQFAKKVTNAEVKKFASNFIKYSSNSKRIHCRQSSMLLAYCPVKMEIEPEKLEIDELFKPTNKRIMSSNNQQNQEIMFKVKLHEFEHIKEIDLVIQNEMIKFYENVVLRQANSNANVNNNEATFIHSLIKTISNNKVDFIITREENCMEIFTSQQGSFFIEFKDIEDFVKCSFCFKNYFSQANKFINSEIKQNQSKNLKIYSSILADLNALKMNSSTDSQSLTNFEYLMMLNYFAGFSFHKSGKIPTLPLNGQQLSAQRFFLPEFFISKVNENENSETDSSCADPLHVYSLRHQLEEMDVQTVAKKIFGRFFVPKTVSSNMFSSEGPITQKCYRDLKLEQRTIISGGFIEQIVSKSKESASLDSTAPNDEASSHSGITRMIFIVTRDGQVHFVEILRNKLKHVKSYTSSFLKENIIVNGNNSEKADGAVCEDDRNDRNEKSSIYIINSGDGFLAISNKMAQRFTPGFESQIVETPMEPPLIAMSGNDIVFVTNGCDVKKCTKQKTGQNVAYSANSNNVQSNQPSAAVPSNSTTATNSPQPLNLIMNKLSISSNFAANPQPSVVNGPVQKKLHRVSSLDQVQQRQSFDHISTSDSKITCITCSAKYGIIIYGTEKCQLYVFSMGAEKALHSIINISDKDIISSEKVKYVGNEPQKVLVTSGWGFIITEAQKKIFVHTLNGTFVRSFSIENVIVDWCCATNSRGEDFVIFIDSESRIGIFEAGKKNENDESNEVKFIQGQPETIALTYNNEFQCIVTLAMKDGVLTLSPMSLDNFN